MLPRGAIGGKDTFTQQRNESFDPPGPEAEILELQGHDRFKVLRLNGHIDDLAHEIKLERVQAHFLKAGSGSIEEAFLFQVAQSFEEDVEAEEGVPGGEFVDGFAAMFFDHAAAAAAGGELPVEIVDSVEGGEGKEGLVDGWEGYQSHGGDVEVEGAGTNCKNR